MKGQAVTITTNTRACLRGCTIRRQHTPTPPDDHDDDTCTGCLPRPAAHGNLCDWCWQRLNADVVDSPSLARYLWAVARSGEVDRAGVAIRGGDPAERTVIHPAIDALDGVHAVLASWAHLILEEHPNGHQMRGPDERAVRLTHTTKQLDPDEFPHMDDEPRFWVRSPEAAGVRNPEATSALVKWLLPLLRWCSEQEWAGEMRSEIANVVRTTAARYPIEERTRPVPGITCPACGRVSLVFDPPTPERHTTQVNCATRGCGVIYSEDDFKRLARIVEWEHGQAIA